MIFDKTGRRVMVGHFVDVVLNGANTTDGMYKGDVVHIEEPSALTNKQGFAVVRVMLQIPVRIIEGKESITAYIVGLMQPPKTLQAVQSQAGQADEPENNGHATISDKIVSVLDRKKGPESKPS